MILTKNMRRQLNFDSDASLFKSIDVSALDLSEVMPLASKSAVLVAIIAAMLLSSLSWSLFAVCTISSLSMQMARLCECS